MIANKSNKAIVLIATIATLAVISVIVMFFAQSSMFERRIASNDNLERQAKLVATASIEWAASYIPKLAMGADDGDEKVKSKAYSSVADFYQFKVKNKNFEGYDPHCPVEEHYLAGGRSDYVGTPSFHYKNKEENNLPYEYSYRQDFDINMVALPTKHNPNDKLGDNTVSKGKPRWTVHSTLKCVDANAFWNINSPITREKDDSGNVIYTNIDNYQTMVKNLLLNVLKNDNATSTWVNERIKGEFSDLGNFRERMSSKINQADLDKICRYITVDSWSNKKSFLYGKYKDQEKFKDYNHIYQEPTSEEEEKIFEKRYPININVASWEILATVFANIQTKNGICIDRDNEAIPLAKDIVQRRSLNPSHSFKTWNDVEKYLYGYFIKEETSEEEKKEGKRKAEAIFANIYPGMLPNKKSPNREQYREFDKSDIVVGTTECCLFSPGVFYCEAIGRVIEYNKTPYTVLAHSKVSVNMKLWEPYIVNSQADFESQRSPQNESDAWSGIEGGITPTTNYNKIYNNNVVVGYLQEKQEKKEDKESRYWKWSKDHTQNNEDNEKEMRSDGLYLENQADYGVLDVSSSYSEWNEWNNNGFDLWIKPSYDKDDDQDAEVKLDNNTLPIAMKVEESPENSCYILTRCAYDKGVDYDKKMNPKNRTYLTLSRTLCLKSSEQIGKDCNERDTSTYRVFYNKTIKNDVKTKISSAGLSIYNALTYHIQDNFLDGEDQIVGNSDYEQSFKSKFLDNIYNWIMEGKNEENFDIPFNVDILHWDESWIPYHVTGSGTVKIYIPKGSQNGSKEMTKWDKAQIISLNENIFINKGNLPSEFIIKGKNNEGNDLHLYYYMTIFNTQKDCKRSDGKASINWINPRKKDAEQNIDGIDSDLLYYGYISRKQNETKEAKEIAWFPGKGQNITSIPVQTAYKYSRTECRIPITLYKGRWYHIHARWEENKILINEFDVSYKKMESKKQEDGDSTTIPEDRTKIHTENGFIRKNFIGGPGRLWVNKNEETSTNHDTFIYPAESEKNKIHYYCPNCVIYYSNYRNANKKYWRYGAEEDTKSIYNGFFDLSKMHENHKDPEYFYYGTVAWTQFAPENKENGDARENGAVFNINGNNKFYSWGEEANYSGDLDHPNSIFMKKYANMPNMPFQFDLHDDDAEGEYASHLETTIVDRVVLYMIVQPQPLHWSHNIYKDQK